MEFIVFRAVIISYEIFIVLNKLIDSAIDSGPAIKI